MPSALDYKPEMRFFGLFVGRSGDGKSAAADGFPGKVLDLDFDNRFVGVANAGRQGLLELKNIDYETYNPRGGWDPVDKRLTALDLQRFSGGMFPYKTITINSLTALTRLFVNASHNLQGGRKLGSLRISGPADFNFEATATHQVFDFLRSWPCNIIATAHIVSRYGKPEKEFDKDGNWINQYDSPEIIGEKLSLRDNLGENIVSYFNDVYRFSREQVKDEIRYFVEFASMDLARNSFGIKPGKHDITGKNFYQYFTELVAKQNVPLAVTK